MGEKRRFVVPGEEVGTTEEYIAGTGTFEEKGKIYAHSMGVLELDRNDMTAKVQPMNPPNILKEGDIVIGKIADIRSTMATVEIAKAEGRERDISGDTNGTIHISKISETYVAEVGRVFRIGDIVRAKVVQVKPSIQLVTNQPSLGVLKSFCMVCRKPLRKQNNELYCSRCKRVETRKISNEYGEAKI
ncbi:MAG: exosome complex RNA-binding protein Csl4 [Thermoplasmata archaeon]